MHDENNDESLFIMITKSEILNNKAYDLNRLNSIKEAIHQAVKEENWRSEILQAFTIAAEDALNQEKNHLEVKKNFRKFTS